MEIQRKKEEDAKRKQALKEAAEELARKEADRRHEADKKRK